jgi:hypothetical protein
VSRHRAPVDTAKEIELLRALYGPAAAERNPGFVREQPEQAVIDDGEPEDGA